MLHFSSEQGLNDPPIGETRTLRTFLENNFSDDISFFSKGNYVIVHANDINPCTYSVATMHGFGLPDLDLTKSFGKLVRRKLEEKKEKEDQWPLTPEELLSRIDEGPLPELYNVIYFSTHEYGKLNSSGYAITSAIQATKIWSIASDWETLVTKKRSPKQIVLGLVLHRTTGNKEAVTALHKCNHVISYNDIRLQNNAWAHMVSSRKDCYPSLRKGVVTHSTLDNNDGRQETWTGTGTTHDTNKTLFQLPSKHELDTIKPMRELERSLDLCELMDDKMMNCYVLQFIKYVTKLIKNLCRYCVNR